MYTVHKKSVKDRFNKKFVATYFLENCKYCMNVEVRKDKTTSTSYCSNIKKKKYRYSFKLQTIFYQMLWTKTFYYMEQVLKSMGGNTARYNHRYRLVYKLLELCMNKK